MSELQIPRRIFMNSAVASYRAMFPDRIVKRGLVLDPLNDLNDAELRQGVVCFVAQDTEGWLEYPGREGEYGTLTFAMAAYGRPDADNPTPEHIDAMEEELEAEMLQWFKTAKREPLLDAVYPRKATYSGGVDSQYGWVVMSAEALYV